MSITEWKGVNCLVTGGAGFIGSHLVDLLMAQGAKVRVLDNLVNGKEENLARHLAVPDFELMRGSVADPFDVRRALRGIEVVFHLACLGVRHSLSHPHENHRVNAEGTLLVLEAAREAGVRRFIHCSSSEVYGTALDVPMPESHPTHPCTVYGAGKLAGEAYARAYYLTHRLPVVIVRPFNTFGPRSHHEGEAGEMIPKSIVRVLNGKNIIIFGSGGQTRDFTYVEDTARALVKAAESDRLIGETLNIGSNFEISIGEVANKIVELIGDSGAGVELQAERPGDVGRLYADTARFHELTGWQSQVDFMEGLRRTIGFFKDHPLGIEKLLHGETGRNWQTA